MSELVSVTVKILDKDYQFSCPEEERIALLESADFLNNKMREIRDSGKVIGLDRMAVMAALNIANELLQNQSSHAELEQTVTGRLQEINQKVDTAIGQDGTFDF
ncbi:MAG: cell division protein ZapA [Gammaproteobacteria bacterium]|nr:cell division protein ZapA [Gammaproteobacteria bacterium]